MVTAHNKIKCPKCSDKIAIPITEEERIKINCKSCGAKGTIKNPNFRKDSTVKTKIEAPKAEVIEKKKEDIRVENKEHVKEEPTTIKCPKCNNDIEVARTDKKMLTLECRGCGAKSEVGNPYLAPAEVKPADDAEPEVEILICPKCEGDIVVPYSTDEKVIVQCPGCGAMGRINNPHLEVESKAEPEEPSDELEGPESARGLLETINCPKCSESISVPRSTDTKLNISCNSCGAKGKINNPYL